MRPGIATLSCSWIFAAAMMPSSAGAQGTLAAGPEAPQSARRSGRTLLKAGAIVLGLSSVPITASILMFTLYHPISDLDCSRVGKQDDKQNACYLDNFSHTAPNLLESFGAGLFGVVGTGMVVAGAALLGVGEAKLRRTHALVFFTPTGSSTRPGGGILSVAGRF